MARECQRLNIFRTAIESRLQRSKRLNGLPCGLTNGTEVHEQSRIEGPRLELRTQPVLGFREPSAADKVVAQRAVHCLKIGLLLQHGLKRLQSRRSRSLREQLLSVHQRPVDADLVLGISQPILTGRARRGAGNVAERLQALAVSGSGVAAFGACFDPPAVIRVRI